MAQFQYQAVSADGERQEGLLEGEDQAAVVLQLQQRGLIPLSVEPFSGQKRSHGRFPLARSANRLTDRHVLAFSQELAALLQAGIPLERALEIMSRVGRDESLRTLLHQVQEGVRRGQTLSKVLAERSDAFSHFYLSMIQAAETAGSLEQGLLDLAYYLERSRDLKDRALSAMLYPMILLAVAGLSLIIILTYVVPQFQQLFSDMGQALPLPTRVVIGVAEFLQNFGAWLLLLLLLCGYLLRKWLAQPEPRLAWDRTLLRLPLIGSLVQRLEMARFSRSLGTLMKGGVPLLNGLAIARETFTNTMMAQTVRQAAESLKEGKRLAEPLLASGLFPPLAMQMIQVGEETGNLEGMLIKVANVYDREVDTAIQRLLTVLEPVLIVGLGVMIAGIILSILVAILSINELPL